MKNSLCIIVFFLTKSLFAQPLIESDWLESKLCKDNIKVLEIGLSYSSYMVEHIQCANYTNFYKDGWRINKKGISMVLPSAENISKILEKVRGGGIMSDYSIGDGFGEVIEAMIKKQSPLCNKNLKELNLPKSIRIASILRDKKIIIPNSKTVFKENDDVVFFAENQYINKLEKLLSTY